MYPYDDQPAEPLQRAEPPYNEQPTEPLRRAEPPYHVEPPYSTELPYNAQPTVPLQRVEKPRRGVGRAALAAALLLGLIGGGVAGGVVARTTTPTITKTVYYKPAAGTSAAPASDLSTLPPMRLVDTTSERAVQVVQRVGPAVVTIQVSGVDPQTQQSFQASGSGVIIDKSGDILTNDHVVANGSSFTVVFKSGAKASAKVVGTASYADLAVIHVDAKVPAWAALGDSRQVQPGETVLAIGSPLGSFENTVTEGIISAVGRTLQEPGTANNPSGTTLTGVLQTDAAINHGNSGGPLVDLNGKVIGINTAIVRSNSSGNSQQDPFGGIFGALPFDTSSSDPAQGLGFAIPSQTASAVINRILLHLSPGFLGVRSPGVLDPQTAAAYSLPVGAYVSTVDPGTPAAKAGLRPHDIITAVDGQAIDQNHDLTTVIEMHQPGQSVTLSVYRAGQKLTFHVTLAARPKNAH